MQVPTLWSDHFLGFGAGVRAGCGDLMVVRHVSPFERLSLIC